MCDNIILLNLIESSDSDETKDECVSCGERAYFSAKTTKQADARNAMICGTSILNENVMMCRYRCMLQYDSLQFRCNNKRATGDDHT